MPPQPMTTTVSPGATRAVLKMAPVPVTTAQPINAARSSGISLRIFTIAFSCTSICSANEDKLRNWWILPGFDHVMRLETPGISLTLVLVQMAGRPAVHWSQVPQKTERQVTT